MNNSVSNLWKECVRWLVRVQLIPPNHALMSSDSQLSDFAYFLRDGVALCNLLNKLNPGCLDSRKFFPKSHNSQFLSTKNVQAFLDTCLNCFRVAPCDLFEPEGVFKMENIGEVKDQTIRNTNNLNTTRTNSSFNNLRISSSSNNNSCSSSDINCRDSSSSNTSSSSNSSSSEISVGSNSNSAPKKTAFDYCIEELMNTEETYIKKVITVLKCIMPADYEEKIFFGIVKLCNIHERFYCELKITLNEDCALDIADIFIKFKEDFLIYSDYCRNLGPALKLLAKLENSDTNFFRALKKCESEMKADFGNFMLQDYLHFPFQRILKYPLILKKLVKLSRENKQKTLSVAIKEIEVLALYWVGKLRPKRLFYAACEDLFFKKKILNLKTCGRRVMDGVVKYKIITDSCTEKRYFFLFDKVLVICLLNPKKSDMHNYEMDLSVEKIECGPDTKNKNVFYLTITELGVTFTVTCKSKVMVDEWLKAFEKAKENVRPPGSRTKTHNFQMETFADKKICDICKKLLRPMKSFSREDQSKLLLAGSFDAPGNYNYSPPWFVDSMTRVMAKKVLSFFPNGTFLIRHSQAGEDEYSLNLKYGDEVQNLKISNIGGRYGFAPSRTNSSRITLKTAWSPFSHL
ncbi:hypothetical protein HELRODRAFT_163684 [Helobdella robusta]|uniref:Uncharacterized protein n=1 Tax=Helobdella robusta TaxID=6412 RepID=T1EUC8_HELRO|nr:hypothetical protein HELRODRAFT_163684 [Helobdella robusta]ESN96600.1 hypothetical protein HELRODRAFT_163684 [Helobdella robusta]